MTAIFIDTSAFLAISSEKDGYHREAVEFLQSIMGGKRFTRLITSDYVIDETITRIRFAVGHSAALGWIKNVRASTALEVLRVDEGVFDSGIELFEKYSDKSLSFTDCTSFALMEKKKIAAAFTFDADFEKAGFVKYP
ncbi:MAG: PIN domain-containing protein [Candidatus Hydrothermarchaeaceae archaeon]